MARRGFESSLALVLLSMLWLRSSAQSTCAPTVVSLSPCLGYMTGTMPTPSSSCCTQLATVVQSNARCLCTVLRGGATQLGINLNQTQALTLPGACKIQTPPLSNCNAGVSEPAPAPASPALPTTPSAAGAPPTESSTPTVPSASSPTSPAAPSGPSNATPTTPSTPSVIPTGTGSKTVPTTGMTSSAISSTKIAPAMFFLLLFVGSYGSRF